MPPPATSNADDEIANTANRVMRVVRFGIHRPSARKRAVLDDALRRQTVAYGRALEAVKPLAIERLILAGRMEAARKVKATAVVRELRNADEAATQAMGRLITAAARSARCSGILADNLGTLVKATVQSWIGWRLRFRAERVRKVARAEARLSAVLADPDEAVRKLRARRRRSDLTIVHVLTGARAAVVRERGRTPPAYPTGPRMVTTAPPHVAALDALSASTTKAAEDVARDALNARPDVVGRTPLCWERVGGSKGISLIRGPGGRVDAFLPALLPADAARRKVLTWDRPSQVVGHDEPVRLPATGGLRLPLSFPKHAWQYLDGWEPRTAKLVAVADGDAWRYELHVVFARDVATVMPDLGRWAGLDRGEVHMAALHVGGDDLSDTEARHLASPRLAHLERRMRRAREMDQRRGRAIRASKHAMREAARNEVNRIAKYVVRNVVARRAMLAAEDLTAFAGGDSRKLTRAQYGALLVAIERGLERAGYPFVTPSRDSRIWKVRAAYTSTTCPTCGHVDPLNRAERDTFECVECGHEDHADLNAARIIAERGQAAFEDVRGRRSASRRAEGPPSVRDGGVVPGPVAGAGEGGDTRRGFGTNTPTTDDNASGTCFPERARSGQSVGFHHEDAEVSHTPSTGSPSSGSAPR